MLAALIDGMNEGGELGGTGATGVRRESEWRWRQPQRLQSFHRAQRHGDVLGRRRPDC